MRPPIAYHAVPDDKPGMNEPFEKPRFQDQEKRDPRSAARLPIRVLIADNHKMFLSTLRAWLQSFADYDVIGEAHNRDEALRLAREHAPDIVVLDIRFPEAEDGFAAAQQIASAGHKVLMLSLYGSSEYVRSVFTAGALGYITKDDDPEHLLVALRMVQEGRRYASPRVTELLLDEVLHKHGLLTKRELEMLASMARGMTNQEIAEKYSIAIKTVDAHKQSIFRKLGVHSHQQAVRRGRELGLLERDEDQTGDVSS